MKKLWKTISQIDSPAKILPGLMVLFTRHARYLPEMEWSHKSWTHNIFRVYELFFWRRQGIKSEISSSNQYDEKRGGFVTVYQAHSFEGACAVIETEIREFLKGDVRLPFKIWIPKISMAHGLPMPASPFLFAIAFDASSHATASTGASANTWSHTCTGSNGLICVSPVGPPDSGAYTGNGVTYNSAALTDQGHSAVDNSTGDWYISLWAKIGPSTGANTVSFSGSNNLSGASVSYSGVLQSGLPDSAANSNSAGSSVTTKAFSTTVVASNCWLILGSRTMVQTNWTAGSGTTFRVNGFSTYCQMWDSNGTVGTGSQTLNITGTSDKVGGVIISVAPVVTVNNSAMLAFF